MKRIFWLTMVLMVLLALGNGFAGGQGEQKSSTTMAEKVTFWTSHTPPDSITLQEMVDTYNAQHPQIQVTMVQVPGSETDVAKLMTAVRGGTGPDVYLIDRFTVAQRASAGVLEDLTSLAAKKDPNLASKYLEFAWQEAQFQGKTYALPFDTDARVLFYRKDILRAAGVDPAIFDSSKGPLTVEEVKQIAFKLNKTDASGNYTQIGFIPYDTSYSQGWHYTWGFVFGGKFADASGKKVTPTDPGVVKGFQFIYDWAKEMGPQKVQTFISTYFPPKSPNEQNPFVTGKVAIMVSGDWTINQMRRYAPNAEYGVTYLPVPQKGDKPTSWAGGWSVGIPVGSKVVPAAFDFVSWMAGPEGQKMYLKGTSHLPTVKALLDDKSLFTGNHAFFRELLPFAKSRPPLPVGALYWDSLTTALGEVALNQTTPQAALQQVADQVQPQLDRF